MQRPATTGRPWHATARWMLLPALLALAVAGYLNQRQQIFTWLAAGTEWVLVTCGLATPDGAGMADDQLRRLYYAARMFRAVPPRSLVPLDVWAEQAYPGMGFGMTRTFDTRPVAVVIGGWLFSIPCTYFTDARDCAKSAANTAQLKVHVEDLAPIRPDRVPEFLATASPQIARITFLAAARARPAPGYERASVVDSAGSAHTLYCLDAALAQRRGILQHCLLRFPFNADVDIELYFAAGHRAEWERLWRQALMLVAGFQVRQ